ncbi:hypothetical protein ACFUJY_11460 [Streptomyces sp. NPDC057249]|uniref:hypothetical protein n=1 Tax=Streptomyces sp. NPDC057249 TaxID=3346067 RepID=UPI00363E475D
MSSAGRILGFATAAVVFSFVSLGATAQADTGAGPADAGVSLRCEGAGASVEGNLNWDLVPDGNLNWDSVPDGLDLDLGLDVDLPDGNLNWDSAPVCTVAAGVN